jgi:hypothetical protein
MFGLAGVDDTSSLSPEAGFFVSKFANDPSKGDVLSRRTL